MSHTIELRKVSKYYAGEDSVSMGFSRIDLDLDIGEFVAITGESGSGKSTLLNVISGLDTYEEGEMFVCGEDTTAYNTEDYEVYRKTYIGNIFQDFNLINSYTVYQNIEVVMLLAGKKKNECRKRVLELIKLVGLAKYRNTKVSKLSGGQKQRVAIARALAKDAPIIVADEPTGNLDSKSAASVMETLAMVSGGKLVVIVTHNYEQAEPYVTRKITMHDGRIIEDKRIGEPEETSADDYLVGFSSDANDVEAYTSDESNTAEETGAEDDANADAYAALAETYAAEAASAPDGGPELSSFENDSAGTNGTDDTEENADTAVPTRVSRVERMGNRSIRANAGKPKGMRRGSEFRLGVRNTFNLPAKFILLFIVYFFVSTAVLGQYATTKNSMHANDLQGVNPYFSNSSANRIIVKKADESRFTERDFKRIENTPNISEIIKNDLAIDDGVYFTLGDNYVEGPVFPIDEIKKSDLTYGHMPKDDYEIVISINFLSDIFTTGIGSGSELIGSEVLMKDMAQIQTYEFEKPIRISGIIIDEDISDDDSEYILSGMSKIYVTDTVSNELLISMMASSSKSEFSFDGKKVEIGNERSVYSSSKVPEGKVFILEDQAFYYENSLEEDISEQDYKQIEGKKFSLKIDNHFFESEKKLKVAKVITKDNCKKLIGIQKDDFDGLYNCVFINDKDYKELFDKGYYQISVYMEVENDSDETIEALNNMGYTTLAIKDSLVDDTGGYNAISKLLGFGRMLILLIVLFFIAYGVIKLIMRSRNSYYSTLRILGATKKNTSNILRIELILMMVIAYGADLLFIYLVKQKVLEISEVEELLHFLAPADYCVLTVLLLLVSLLIANRYSRSIFKRSAMKTFREEA